MVIKTAINKIIDRLLNYRKKYLQYWRILRGLLKTEKIDKASM